LLKIVGFITKEAGGIINFLQAENKIFRSMIDGKIILSEYDRRLFEKHGLPIKHRLHEFISIVSTFLLWASKIHVLALAYRSLPCERYYQFCDVKSANIVYINNILFAGHVWLIYLFSLMFFYAR